MPDLNPQVAAFRDLANQLTASANAYHDANLAAGFAGNPVPSRISLLLNDAKGSLQAAVVLMQLLDTEGASAVLAFLGRIQSKAGT